jgi:hypothetical protein
MLGVSNSAGAPAPTSKAGFEAALLAALMAVLPFEPRRPVLVVAGLELTLLETAAGAASLCLAWMSRRQLASLLRRPPAPLVLVTSLAGAHIVSGWRAPSYNDLALKFGGRMLAMAAFAWVVAAARPASRHVALWGFCSGTGAVACLAVLEGVGLQGLDRLLDWFREASFTIAGARRATAGAEYPNLAAAFMACGLTCAVGLLSGRRALRGAALLTCALFSMGLLFTYSRGGLLAAALALLLLAAVGWRTQRWRAPVPALALLLAAIGAFAMKGDVFRFRFSAEATRSWFGALYLPLDTSFRLEPGERRQAQVRVSNAGLRAWPAAGGFHLSYHWYRAGWGRLVDGERTRLLHDLAPGEAVLLNVQIRAPNEAGHYLLVWDMVQGQMTWFSGQGVRPRVVPVEVGAATPGAVARPASLPEVGWHPSRRELWTLALAMWREHPLTGVGSDNFRRLYGPWAGRLFWDNRIYANSLYLETAATTGSLGVLALLATLATMAVRCARAASRHGVILLALTGAVVVHGMVDYFLAFTGHYLFFGFLVGAAAALVPAEERS